MSEVVPYPSRAAMAAALAALLAGRIAARLAAAGQARMAVPGGTTPGPMLTALGHAALDWAAVTVTLTDERWLPPSAERSNHRLLRETLFAGAAGAARFVPLYVDAPDPAAGVAEVAAALDAAALPLDIAVLGMGADMHTASMFPGAEGLDAALAGTASAVAVAAPGAPEPRVTLSAPVLAAAERHILITGADKRAALDRARTLADPAKAPILAVLDGATIHYAD